MRVRQPNQRRGEGDADHRQRQHAQDDSIRWTHEVRRAYRQRTRFDRAGAWKSSCADSSIVSFGFASLRWCPLVSYFQSFLPYSRRSLPHDNSSQGLAKATVKNDTNGHRRIQTGGRVLPKAVSSARFGPSGDPTPASRRPSPSPSCTSADSCARPPESH
jgi:hypothetical protein